MAFKIMLKIMRAKTSKMMGEIVSWITVCGCGRFVKDFACTYVRTCPRPHLILRFGDGFQKYAQNHARGNFKNDGKGCFMNYGMWLWPFCTGFCMHLCTNMFPTSPYAHIWRWLSKLYSKSCARDFSKWWQKLFYELRYVVVAVLYGILHAPMYEHVRDMTLCS